MPHVFDVFINQYPELWDENFENEIKLLFAIQIMSKSEFPEFRKQIDLAFDRFFT